MSLCAGDCARRVSPPKRQIVLRRERPAAIGGVAVQNYDPVSYTHWSGAPLQVAIRTLAKGRLTNANTGSWRRDRSELAIGPRIRRSESLKVVDATERKRLDKIGRRPMHGGSNRRRTSMHFGAGPNLAQTSSLVRPARSDRRGRETALPAGLRAGLRHAQWHCLDSRALQPR